MPELNFRVKIQGGKKTPLGVWVTPQSINGKSLSFQNGTVISENEFADIIHSAIIYYVNNGNKQCSLDTIAKSQGVKPIDDIGKLKIEGYDE